MFYGIEPIEVAGALGASMILFGFYRTSIGRWTNRSILYELDNMLGAGLLMFYNFNRGATISVVLDIVWIFVALRGITSIAERHGEKVKK